ncbi:MAG: SPFH domain-containing protein [Ruminococcaceae bacterium]|nr:SPFH domain-containing protein [Oscillospiraceae bacterium]
MGIIKASVTAFRGAAADQWKEMFCAGEMGSDVLMTRARKLTSQNGANQGFGEVITDGSIIVVGEGECAVATEGGKVIGVYDQPGEQIFKSNQSKGVFGGGLSAFAKDVGRRIAFGGDITISQRLYYINTKELTGGTIRAAGVPLRFKDLRAGVDMDGGVSCYGSYTFRIAKPELFYRAAIRSIDGRDRMTLLKQMDSEVLTALPPALTLLIQDGVRPNELMKHTKELCQKLRQVMSKEWSGLRGVEVVSVALESVRVLGAAELRTLQRDTAFTDPLRAAGHLVGAQADAIQTAAANQSGTPALVGAVLQQPPTRSDDWKCKCGAENKGKFCIECGEKKPEEKVKSYCEECGWKVADKLHPPKFCPECGTPFKKTQ